MPEAVDFVKTNQIALGNLPVAYFFTCLTLAKRNAKTEQQALAYSDKLVALSSQVMPVGIGRFAGVLDFSKMSFLTRFMLKTITTVAGVREGDYRDWDAIRSWAQSIHVKLSNEQTKVGHR
jgi:menaquinone-dependent protoporphyrinogen oxidase